MIYLPHTSYTTKYKQFFLFLQLGLRFTWKAPGQQSLLSGWSMCEHQLSTTHLPSMIVSINQSLKIILLLCDLCTCTLWCMYTCMHMYVEVSWRQGLCSTALHLSFGDKTSHWTWWSPRIDWLASGSCLCTSSPPVLELETRTAHWSFTGQLKVWTQLFMLRTTSTVPVGSDFFWKLLVFRSRTFASLVTNLIICLEIIQSHEFRLLPTVHWACLTACL